MIWFLCILLHVIRVITGDADVLNTNSWETDLPPRCVQHQSTYATNIAKFTNCAIRAARPLSPCLDCLYLRQPLETAYQHIQGDGECAALLLPPGGDGVIEGAHRFYLTLIERSRCHLCEDRLEDGRLNLKPQVPAFLQANDRVTDCFQGNLLTSGSASGNATLCAICGPLYSDACHLFQKCVENPMEWRTCRDVMDKANTSMHLWQRGGCVPEPLSRTALVALGSTVVLAVIVVAAFYYGMALWVKRQEASATTSERPRHRPQQAGHVPYSRLG